jgi:hypothetical protein
VVTDVAVTASRQVKSQKRTCPFRSSMLLLLTLKGVAAGLVGLVKAMRGEDSLGGAFEGFQVRKSAVESSDAAPRG